MPIPDYQTLMLPLLKLASDQKERTISEVYEIIAQQFDLSDKERSELLPSGRQAIFENRVGWAKTYLKKAGLMEYPKRGSIKITSAGLGALKLNPKIIDNDFLSQFDEFNEFKTQHLKDEPAENAVIEHKSQKTPEELIEEAYTQIRNSLASDLLSKIKCCSPSFFERLVVDLLVTMGYGGSRKDAGQAIGRSGDGGIDGIINEDKLGLDVVYIQAKRWEGSVGRPEIQKFVGALAGHRAKKGVFITSSYYTSEALDYVQRTESKIILIDGKQLSNLMIDHGIGVTQQANYEVKRLDSDYFIEE